LGSASLNPTYKMARAAGRDAKMYITMKGLPSDGLFDRMVESQF
jgi:hypothetical protein